VNEEPDMDSDDEIDLEIEKPCKIMHILAVEGI
jgi:hypothetical protein